MGDTSMLRSRRIKAEAEIVVVVAERKTAGHRVAHQHEEADVEVIMNHAQEDQNQKKEHLIQEFQDQDDRDENKQSC